MKKILQNGIPTLFNLLFFFTPLIFFPKTSELFEFNKIIFIYLITALVTFFWLTRIIYVRKVIFRRTMLDVPLLIFLVSQFLSFLVSIDRHTSLLGYYGRFNGGLVSLLAYCLLYWAFVSNMNAKSTRKSLYFLFAGAFLVCLYGVLQHFGVDKNLWVQDVQNRVFSTLGQPNWLATFLIALIPLTLAFSLKTKRLVWWGLSIIFFIVLLYTKSRSGILGFAISFLIFWVGLKLFGERTPRSLLKKFLLITSSLLLISFIIGTPWTPSLENLLTKSLPSSKEEIIPPDPGGTESGEIRKIVWNGAIEIWKHYPYFGSGVETFAYSFYEFRPKELNKVSEWDFLFNKAHNEYLNYAATTGTVGLLAYFTLIVFSVLLIFKSHNPLKYALGAGYGGILVANFFGFATTTTSLLFFFFPAIAVGLGQEGEKVKEYKKQNVSAFQMVGLTIISLFAISLFYSISKYWYADFLFAKGKMLGDEKNFSEAKGAMTQAISLSPKEAIYLNELAQLISFEALALNEEGNKNEAKKLSQEAIKFSQDAVKLAPRNLLLVRGLTSVLIRLSIFDPIYMHDAKDTMLLEAKYSPTDAKLYYNLGLAYARIGQTSDAVLALEKTVELKDNYRDARFALALLYVNTGRKLDAERELRYILEQIDPDDALTQQELHEITEK